MLWSLDEEKIGSVNQIINEWYESDDALRVAVALHIPCYYPCESRIELVQFLERMEEKWPKAGPRCKTILENWDKEGMDLQFEEQRNLAESFKQEFEADN